MPKPGEHVFHPFAGEDPHQVVFQREVEPARAGVSLPAAAAAKLQVDAAGFVPLGADDVQAAQGADFLPFGLHLLALFDLADQVDPFLLRHVEAGGVFVLQLGPGHRLGVAAEDDVGAAAGHVGGDGHGVFAAGLGDDLGLAFVVLGVEHLVLDAAAAEHRRELFAFFDRHGADQDRPAAFLNLLDAVAGDRARTAPLPSLGRISTPVSSWLVIAPISSAPSFISTTSNLWSVSISSAIALYFSRSLRKITSG